MRTFTHLMPGEIQGCIGCHSERNQATPSIPLNAKRPSAMLREAQELEKPEWGVKGFSYSRIVQPVWNKNCLECHGAEDPAAGLELTADKTDFFNVSYENLVRRGTSSERSDQGWVTGAFRYSKYTSWIPTYNGQEENILEIDPGRWGAKASLLAEIIREGHPDKDGKRMVNLSSDEQRRVFAWLDLNCPYYGTSDSNHQDRRGCRQMVPDGLDATIKDVASRRCVSCHQNMTSTQTLPNSFYLRIDNPAHNLFLRAPLAKSAGGTEACGSAVFADTNDPDYQKLLDLFEPLRDTLSKHPRMDMQEATE